MERGKRKPVKHHLIVGPLKFNSDNLMRWLVSLFFWLSRLREVKQFPQDHKAANLQSGTEAAVDVMLQTCAPSIPV